MARYKSYDYNQLMMVPVSLDKQLSAGSLEYAIHRVIEEYVDTSIFDDKYRNDETGCCAYDPKILLKIILFAYARGILHSRRMERACRENIIFMALACGQQPDHSTLAGFVSSMGIERITGLFTQVLLVCEKEGLLGGTHFSLDGLKLSSNASKEWSGTHSDLLKKKERLEQKVKEAIREQAKEDAGGEDYDAERKEKRIKRLTRNAERIGTFIANNKPRKGRRGNEVQSNVTDNESAKMVSSHGVVQGYNANALVDENHQVVVHAEAFGEGEDAHNMGPMLGTAYCAPKTACRCCGLRSKCLRNPNSPQRQVYFFHTKPTGGWAYEMRQKIDTVEGRKMYGKRMKIVEPVSGNVRAQKDMDRFTMRGQKKVTIQWRLYCIVHNIEKILHYGRSFTQAA